MRFHTPDRASRSRSHPTRPEPPSRRDQRHASSGWGEAPVDLKEQFQARVTNTGQTPAAFALRLSEFENLKAVHAKLVAHCTELEERLLVYATVINVLSLENRAANTTARVADIHTRRPRHR